MHILDRFLKYVNKNSGIFGKDGNYPTECWIYTGFCEPKRGYGRFYHPEGQYAHRFSFIYFKGQIDPKLQIHHLCQKTACVNPEHLIQIKPRLNTLLNSGSPAKNYNKVNCPQNHLLLGSNLYVYPNGRRGCKKCLLEQSRKNKKFQNKYTYNRFCQKQHIETENNIIIFSDENINRCLTCCKNQAQRLYNRIKQDNNISFDIILPTVNRPSLKEAIQSILNQNYQKWILYVIGDGIKPSYKIQDDRIVYLNTNKCYNDSGATPRNIGINIGFSNWILYNDCDDLWCSNHVCNFVDLINENPDCTMFKTGGQAFRYGHKHSKSSKKVLKLEEINTQDPMTVSMCHSRELFNKTPGWQDIPERHDHQLWNDMLAAGGKPVMSNEVTFLYRR